MGGQKKLISHFFWGGILLTLLGFLWPLSGLLYRPNMTDDEFLKTAPLVDLDTRVLDILSFGYRGLYDDFVTIWMLQVLMDPRVNQLNAEKIQNLLVRVGRHQPKIESYYLLGCFVLNFDLKRPDLCEPILKQGTEAFPTKWRIPVTMGIIAAHYLQDPRLAALYYEIGAQRGAPQYIRNAAQRLAKEQNISPEELKNSFNMILEKEAAEGVHSRPSRLMETLRRRNEQP